jgi:hypothetical protein
MDERLKERVTHVVREEAEQIRAVGTDAVKSQAYLYPIKVILQCLGANLLLTHQGVFYFVSHPDLWKPLKSKML